jgi:hypothetical protein
LQQTWADGFKMITVWQYLLCVNWFLAPTILHSLIQNTDDLFLHQYTRVAQKIMPHFFFLISYLFRMYEIHAQFNWMFPLHMLFFHITSIYVYGRTPARNKGMRAFPVPACFLFA